MITDEDVLRDLLTSSAPTFDSLDGLALREHSTGRRPRGSTGWSRALPAAAAAVVIAAIAVGATALAQRTRPHSTGSAHSPKAQTSHSIASGSSAEAGTFRLQLTLNATSVPADGTPIRGYVLAINHTGKPIEIRDASCDDWVQVGLSGHGVTFGLYSSDVACGTGQLREGVTRIPVKIATTYTGCQQGSRPGTVDMPQCVGPHDAQIPPLPPGEYEVNLGTQNVSPAPALPQGARLTLTLAR